MNYLSNQPYKGTRDFYPSDMFIRTWMFNQMRKVVQSYGYREYDGPLIESFELYKQKSGEEIVNRQLYHFLDKSNRQVAIRPEMTPTVARMVSRKIREYQKPIRWFSIPNVWRYEQPSKGRLREHWQLNVDIFGSSSIEAEVEILLMAIKILENFGAKQNQYKLKISNRILLESFLSDVLKLDEDKKQALCKILDKKDKISKEEFSRELKVILSNFNTQFVLIEQFLDSNLNTLKQMDGINLEALGKTQTLFSLLESLGLKEQIEFDTSIIRGFDYYTGIIFEIFDTNKNNSRSIYGGGRYDNLINLFSNQSLTGIGFGLGDVTLQSFLENYGLLPKFSLGNSVFLPLLEETDFIFNLKLAEILRKDEIKVEVSLQSDKLKKQIQTAEKKGYKYIILYGSEERKNDIVQLKNLETFEQVSLNIQSLIKMLKV